MIVDIHVHPLRGLRGAVSADALVSPTEEMLERCVKDYGFKGVKLHDETPGFPLTGFLGAQPPL